MMIIKPKNFKNEHLEWVVLKDIKPMEGEYAFVTESFSPFIAFMELPDSNTFEKYNQNLAEFCNNRLWGTLSCTLIIPDKEMKEHEDQVYATVDQLKYGAVSINSWAGQVYGNYDLLNNIILFNFFYSIRPWNLGRIPWHRKARRYSIRC
jgi:hypothetical protein